MPAKSLQKRLRAMAKNLFLFLFTLLISSEVILRLTSYEEDSRIYVFGNYPVALPPTLEIWKQRLQKLAEAEQQALHYSTYDSLLGWAYRPNHTSQDSLYIFNEFGMRAHPSQLPDCQQEGSQSCFHILLSGNSYMMSAEVPGEQSLAYYLEEKLWREGIPCHVINGAAGNYSLDQAYLQWKYKAKQFKPDLVVLGINPRHFSGNTSIYPYCSFPETRIYYSKPRTIQVADSLQWLNLPTVQPSRLLPDIISDFEHSPWYAYEQDIRMPILRKDSGWQPYLWRIWQRYMIFSNKPVKSQKINEEAELSKAIIKQFQQELSQEGTKMLLMQNPVYEDVLHERLKYLFFVKFNYNTCNVKEGFDCLPTINVFEHFPLVVDGFMPGLAHYSPETNEYLAKALADKILSAYVAKPQ